MRRGSLSREGTTTILTSVSAPSLLAYQEEAANNFRGRTLKGVKVITSEGVFDYQIGENANDQVMVNTIEEDSYVGPHYHPDPEPEEAATKKPGLGRFEYFSMEPEFLKGHLKIICFSDDGIVSSTYYLKPGGSNVIPGGVYHSVVALEDSQVLEVKPGAYLSEARVAQLAQIGVKAVPDKILAHWAPAENTPEGAEFLEWMRICNVGQDAKNYKEILKQHRDGLPQKHEKKLEETAKRLDGADKRLDALEEKQRQLVEENERLKGALHPWLALLSSLTPPQCNDASSQRNCVAGAFGFLYSLWSGRASPSFSITARIEVNNGVGLFTMNDASASPRVAVMAETPAYTCGLL